MAAPTAAEQTADKVTDSFLNHVNNTSNGFDALTAGSGELQDFVLDFVHKEVGSDLKSLKNVGDLLEKLREENIALEEQVKKRHVYLLLTKT